MKNKDVQLWAGMIIGSVIYSFGIVFVLNLGEFYAGGVTGIAQIVATAVGKIPNMPDLTGVTSTVIILVNFPLFLIGWRGVSKRFAIASIGSVVLQALVIWLFEEAQRLGFDPLKDIAANGDILTLSILGGLITGAGCGICLKYGSSSGGMDIVSQYVSLKKKISFSKFTLIIDFIIIAGSIVVTGKIETAVYTIIRMIISVLVLDKIHTIYKNMKISIVTDNKDEMRDALVSQINHALTIYEAEGGYSKKKKYVIESVISSYESFEVSRIARQVDPKCFVTYTSIKKIEGLFNHNVIA